MFFRRVLTSLRPVVKTSLQVAAIYTAGDFTQQKFVTKVEEYNYASTKNVAIVGACISGPLYTIWYNFLNRRLPSNVGRTLVKKLVLDQIIAGGVGTIIFFVALSVLEKKENTFQEVIEKGPIAFACNTLYWPIVMFGIFKKVPVPYQPVTVACFDFFWSIFLCYYKMKDIHSDGKVVEAPITKEFERRAIDKVKVNAKES